MTDVQLHVYSYTTTPPHIGPPRSGQGVGRMLLSSVLEGCQDGPVFDLREAIDALDNRETILPTAAGGVALPHAEIDSLSAAILVVLCEIKPGMPWPWNAVDGVPISNALILLGPRSMAGVYMRVQVALSRAARTLITDGGRTGLRALVKAQLEAMHRPIWHDWRHGPADLLPS